MNAPALLLLLSLAGSAQGFEPLQVSVRESDEGRVLCSVRAEQSTADRVLDAIARRMSALPGRDPVVVEGFTPPLRAALVTVTLEDRDVDTALEWILGSVGLDFRRRPGVISVFERETELDHEALTSEAMLAYVRATRRFPDHTLAATARMHQGRIEEARANLSAALGHYEAVQEGYRDSHHLPEAVWRRGRVMQRMGSWAEANLAFRTLANSGLDHEWHAAARLEMARCAIELGDPVRARHVVAALEESHPAEAHGERVDRRLVAARAELEAGHAMQCLRGLEPVLDGELTDEQRARLFRLQAGAFEAVERPSEAAWAWQAFSRLAAGEQRIVALENAARLSLEAGEELNVLFLEELAEKEGARERLAPYALEAASRLGLGSGRRATSRPEVAGAVERAERLLEAGDPEGASRLLEPHFQERAELEAGEAVLVVSAWARCLAELRGLEAAVRVLSRERGSFEDVEERRRIDLAAASLFEERDLFDRAVDAYEGRY